MPQKTRRRVRRTTRRKPRRGAGVLSFLSGRPKSLTDQFVASAKVYDARTFKPRSLRGVKEIPRWFHDQFDPRPSATRLTPAEVEGTSLVAWWESDGTGGPHGDVYYFVKDIKTGAEERMLTVSE